MTNVLIEPPRDCDECGAPMAPSGGICRRCGQRLCGRHLFGRWQFWRRLSFVERVCVGCRRRALRMSAGDGLLRRLARRET